MPEPSNIRAFLIHRPRNDDDLIEEEVWLLRAADLNRSIGDQLSEKANCAVLRI